MNTIHHGAQRVNPELPSTTIPYDPLNGASIVEWFKYRDTVAGKLVVQGVGYSNGIVCSDRTRAGKLHETNGFNVRDNLVEAMTRRYDTFLIRITWKRSGRKIHYAIPIDDIRKYGEQQDRYDGWQWHVPLRYWLVNGQEPEAAQPEPEPEPAPVAEQPALFDFAEAEPVSRWGGGY